VTADELISYVEREVRSYTRGAAGRVQSPVDMGDFPDNMILGFSPAKRTEIIAKLPLLSNGTVVIDVNLDYVEVFIDEKSYGTAGHDKPFPIPGLSAGAHKVKGVRMGYEPVTVDVNVVPGSTQTVSLRLLYQRTVKPHAKEEFDQAVDIWQRSQSSPADLTKAAGLLSSALKEQPDYSQAALQLCRIQQKQDQTVAALKSCKHAVDLDPDFVEARIQTGALLMESGDYQEAVRQLQQAATKDPRDTMAASTLAEALYLADRPKEAEDAANKALALDGSSGQAYLMRGEARRAQKNWDGAVDDYQTVLKLEELPEQSARVFREVSEQPIAFLWHRVTVDMNALE
jgi:lipopolysaccharide biosynthesis regulator YciM